MSDVTSRIADALADRYRIERELGAGGMATVYLAEDLKHKRKVALKVLRPELAAVLGGERFVQEITTTASLQHPHILQLFDSGNAGGWLYYVTPFVEGGSLRDRMDREGRLSVEDALRITATLAGALDFAHKRGVIHRDIKPENILFQDGVPLVADFGIAVAVTSAGGERLTETGLSLGTPAYMSPEQIAGERDLDTRSDVYSLACVTYEMLAGDPPFLASSAQAVIAKHITDPAPPITTSRPDASPAIASAIAKALRKAPADRFPRAGVFAEALTATGAEETPPASIVVLPFANRSPDAENEFFSDGLTEEIIADLASLRALSVISRTSSMRLKGTDKDVRTIGRELGVRYVLEGSVRKAGQSLRITAQLIDATTDQPLWAEKYAGTMDDVFEVQERVAREIVAALGITLTSEEDRHLAQRPIEDARAFELFLQARQEMRRYDAAAIERGEEFVRRAIAIAGEAVPLQALSAWGKVARVRAGLAPDKRGLDEATTVAENVLRAAPDAPYGHALLGFIDYERGAMPEAISHLRAALEREPNDADALFYLGICLQACGHIEAGERTAQRLMASDPLSPLSWLLSGLMPWWSGRASAGIANLERALAMDPGNAIIRWTLGYGRALAGDVSGASGDAQVLLKEAPALPYTRQLAALVYAMEGRQSEARALLEGVLGLDAHHKFHLSESCCMAGDTDRALALLEEAVNTGFHPGDFIACHGPFLEPLRGTPRFEAIAATALHLTREFVASEASGSEAVA